jgi:phage-related minor tail protein
LSSNSALIYSFAKNIEIMSTTNEFRVKGEELLKKIKEIIHEGNVSRIIIKDDSGRTFLEIPITIGVVGAIFAPVLAAIGALAALAANFTVEVIRKE